MCISSIVVKSCRAENSWVLVPISEDRTTTEKEKRAAIDFFTRQKKLPDRPSPPDPTRVIKRYQSRSRGRGCTTCRGQRWAQEVLKYPRPIASSCVDSGVKSRARSREPCGVVVASQTYFCVQLQCSEDNKYCSTVTITIRTKVHRRDCR